MSGSGKHCGDIHGDRAMGAYWERQFCILAANFNKVFTPMQIGREASAQAYSQSGGKWSLLTLPDITIWTRPGEHHEIKHKSPTKYGSIGLEVYRFEALKRFSDLTGQDVFYTIHRHDLAGGRNAKENNIAHWFTASVKDLQMAVTQSRAIQRTGPTYCNGLKKDVPILYWSVLIWKPLEIHFNSF
jgi:hypothetical protein